MKTLQITETNALALYPTASGGFKAALEDTFGKEFFSKKITDRVKTYEDACRETGDELINEARLRALGFTDDEINYRKLKTVTKALNEGWIPDWADDRQAKYTPYFRLSFSGFEFGSTFFNRSAAGDGSRLCFKSSELAEYAGKQFTDLYKGFMF